ncbi:C6 transcription factor [Apiospora arundinis]|uniref:C6 transcription factor n=1 Tax=Apiospora arundinis TaxID=335852 RepID=A0ABR2HLL6_9PEZI
MRVIISIQAGLTTAMIAALYLESSGTRLQHLPIVSMMRTVNVSPLNFVFTTDNLIFSSISSRRLAFVCVMATSALAILTQFISTVLLTDFDTASIPAPLVTGPILDPFVTLKNAAPIRLDKAPDAYWRFAEQQNSPGVQTTVGNTNFLHTGVTHRASLPWPHSKDRVGLRSFSGVTEVWDAGVICFNPSISRTRWVANNTFTVDFGIVDKHPQYSWYGPFVSTSSTFTLVCQTPDDRQTSRTALCKLRDSDQMHKFAPAALVGVLMYNFETSKPNSTSYRDTSLYDEIKDKVLGGDASSRGWKSLKKGPWAHLLNKAGREMLSLSICITDYTISRSEVVTSGISLLAEPRLGDSMPGEHVTPLNATRRLRRQLGIENNGGSASHEARGIMKLDSFMDSNKSRPGPLKDIAMDNRSVPLFVYGETFENVHWAHIKLFDEILYYTGNNSALAIQAFSTILNQMHIFHLMGLFAISDPGYWKAADSSLVTEGTYRLSQHVLVPLYRGGLYTVIALVALHIAFVILISFHFHHRTRSTLLGNAWQSIAQVVSDQTYEALQQADNLKDEEVNRILGKHESKEIGVVQVRDNGRNEFGPK